VRPRYAPAEALTGVRAP